MNRTIGFIIAIQATEMIDLAAIMKKVIEIRDEVMKIKTILRNSKKLKKIVFIFYKRDFYFLSGSCYGKMVKWEGKRQKDEEEIWFD